MEKEEIKKLKDDIFDLQERHKRKANRSLLLWGVTIILLGALLATQCSFIDLKSNYGAIVLGFVGVLATFVVISNYSELRGMKEDFEVKSSKVEREFKEAMEKLGKRQIKFEKDIETLSVDFDKKIRITGIQNELYNDWTSGNIAKMSKQYVSALNLFFKALDKSISLYNEKELRDDMINNARLFVGFIYEIISKEGSNIDISDLSILRQYVLLMLEYTNNGNDSEVDYILRFLMKKVQEIENK